MSLQQLIIDDEIAAYTRRLSAGFRLDEETLGFEVVHQVGPRGHYLSDEHTFLKAAARAIARI